MLELQIILDFACCGCQGPLSVTVKCSGKGLAPTSRAVASCTVPCPTCGTLNQLFFEPNGTVRGVTHFAAPRPLPEPSIN